MKSKKIINARQLILLCCIRKCEVLATDLKHYEWTIAHQLQAEGLLANRKARTMDDIIKARIEIIKIVNDDISCITRNEKRMFKACWNIDGYLELLDENNTSWYVLNWYESVHPEFDGQYKGNFELSMPLSDMEFTILNSFAA